MLIRQSKLDVWEYLGELEMLYNPDFNCTEFGIIKIAAGSNNFVLSVKS